MGKSVDRSTWQLLLLKGFLDTKWFQTMMKDYIVDNIFLGALFYPGSNTIFFLNK